MGAKKTSELIPLCHNIELSSVDVSLTTDPEAMSVTIRSKVRCVGKTGVEMEALMAVSVSALALYDMCKSVSKEIRIGEIRLVKKTGGKSDFNHQPCDQGQSR